MAVTTCCIPAAAGVTAGAVVTTALGYMGDRRRGKGKTEDSKRQHQLQKARTSTDHFASKKAQIDLTGTSGKQFVQPMPVEIQARMDHLHRILEAAVEEKKATPSAAVQADVLATVTAGPCSQEELRQGVRELFWNSSQEGTLRPAFEEVAQTQDSKQARGEVSAKTLERKVSAQTEEGLNELIVELESAEGKYKQAEQHVLLLEQRLQQLEVAATPRAVEVDCSLNQMQAPELQQRVLALGKALEDKEKALEAAKAALEEQEGHVEELRRHAQSLEGQGTDLEQHQELTRQMKRTAELREVEVNMLGHQLGEAQAEADTLRNQLQQTEAVLEKLHARLKEQEEVLASNSPSRWEDMRERCHEAEGQYQQLQRQLHEEREQVELHKQEKEQHLQALNASASEHKLLSQRVDHLESAVDQKDLQILELQEAVRAQEAEAAGQVGSTDHEFLKEQATAAHAQVANLEASLVQLKQQAEDDKAAMQAQLNMEMEKAGLLEKAMREAEAESHEARRAAAAAQRAAAAAEQEAAELREDKVGTPCTPKEAMLGGEFSPSRGSPSPRSQSSSTPNLPQQEQRSKSKLTTHELQALQVRLNAAESRLKVEEAKKQDMNREIEMLRKEVSLAKTSVQNKAEQAAMVEQLMAQMEAERGAAREQLDAQRQAFEKQLEEATAASRPMVDTSALDAALEASEGENKLLKGEVAALKAELVRAADPPSMPGSKGSSAVVLARAGGGSREALIQTAPAHPLSAAALAVPVAGAVRQPSCAPGQRMAVAPSSPLRAAPTSPGSSANTQMGASPQLSSRPVLVAPAKAAGPLAANPSSVGAAQPRPRRVSAAGGVPSARPGRVPATQADPGRRLAPREPLVSAAAIGASQALSASMPGAVMGSARRPAASPPGAFASGKVGPLRS